ncbi:MAG: DNA translocase FtsK 4TM domain-containing protein [Ardenticatenaceae bacterium]|nr:DNA translocase FtsK 4TM domain-containing protein [Ardenticatenaceae bacterium]MCB9446137.1 DNA translocase FtsK 4TM domain-containing protein [Ardenticatenaceae bacterium]
MAKKKTTTGRKSSNTRKTDARTSSRKTSTSKRSSSSKSTRGGTGSRRSSSSRSRSSSRKAPQVNVRLNLQQKALIGGIGIIFVTAVLVLSMLSPTQAQLTSALSSLLWQTFGWGGFLVPVISGAFGLYWVLWGMEQEPKLPGYRLVGFGLFFLTVEALATLVILMGDNNYFDVWAIARNQTGGGYVGGLIVYVLVQSIGDLGAIFTLVVVGIIATILMTGVTRSDLGQFLTTVASWRPQLTTNQTEPADRSIAINPGRLPRNVPVRETAVSSNAQRAVQPPLPALTPETTAKPEPPAAKPARASRQSVKPQTPSPPQEQPTIATPVFLGNMTRGQNWKLPAIADLLESGTDQDLNSATIREQVDVIEHTLESFGAPVTVVEINQGPSITQFGVEPQFIEMRSGKRTKVKVGKIASLADDLALALAAQTIRIQAPVPGKGYVGIEVPNVKKALVSLRDVMESAEFRKIKSPLRIGLGQNVAGQAIAADLSAMPHLLIAGTTGSGKSVMVNSIIAGMLLQNTPEQLKMVMVDPKRVELTGYNGIPHLAAPVVVDMDRVIGTLQWAMREMDNRYKAFAEIGARNINDYNKKVQGKKADSLPFIVIIIDELADLMMLSPEETERGITRLAQMARATGIHMVIATQRPSVDVVTGIIKANFPARIAFAVASSTDSRVILDTTGAERLLGQGDMLFQSPDAAAPVRLQGCFVSDGELSKLIAYWQQARRFNLISAEESKMSRAEAVAVRETPAVQQSPAQQAPPSSATLPPPTRPVPERDVVEIVEETAVTQPSPPPPPTSRTLPEDAPTRPIANNQQSTTNNQQPTTSGQPLTSNSQQPLWEELQRVVDETKDEDGLMPEAIALVRQLQKASTSLLQRRFRIGYTRAARMIDAMEEQGVIGPPTGTSKAREVLLSPENEETEEETPS